MQNIFVIHSYNADTKDSYGPYIVERGTKLGYNILYPSFPIRAEANYEKWATVMDIYFKSGELNSDSIVIAHSLGTHFIPKYLSERNLSVKLFVSVAGFIGYTGREDLETIEKAFSVKKENISSVINLIQHRYSIYSDDDHMNEIEKLEKYADTFNAEKVFIPSSGHFGKESGVKELPVFFEIVEKVLKEKTKEEKRV